MDPLGLDTITITNKALNYYNSKGRKVLSMKIISGHLNVTDPTIPQKGPTPPGAYQLTQNPVALDPDAYPLFCSGNECWWTPYEPLFTILLSVTILSR